MRKLLMIILILVSGNLFAGGRDCVQKTYQNEIGVRELTGNNDGSAVEKYLRSTGLGKGYAWCAAFVNWTLKQCGTKTCRSAAWSPSWFPKEKVIYTRGSIEIRPEKGDVFGLYFASKRRIAHVGFIDSWTDGSSFVTVEGNTNQAGSREGDGVYRKFRLKSQVYQVSDWIGE